MGSDAEDQRRAWLMGMEDGSPRPSEGLGRSRGLLREVALDTASPFGPTWAGQQAAATVGLWPEHDVGTEPRKTVQP